jgi:hypothetical protein
MRRFWIEFNLSDYPNPPISIESGFGVTSASLQEALGVIRERAFDGRELPPISRVVEDVDVSTLDAKHVRPNMGVPVVRGIWFPIGFQ